MATRTATITYDTNRATVVWTGLLNGDDGSVFEGYDWADAAVQITGTFGVGGSINLTGSNDGTNYVVLTDPQGNAITKTSAAIEQVSEGVKSFKPVVTAGDGTTSLTVTMYARRNR
ncbi:MAG: hypothetical protein WAT70_03810 [Rhizobiaceae bacterium]